MKTRIIITSFLTLCVCFSLNAKITVGDERMKYYIPRIEGKKVGVVTNHTAVINGVHLVDTLLTQRVDIVKIFAPEHGFRGDADAGANIASYRDKRTGIDVVSIYGANKKPKSEDIKPLDVVIFDIQDVGTRFYTYLSSLLYVMESCAESGVKLIVLDRPNPNGSYVDGPVLDMKYKSFVGVVPIPMVHGMTLGELALMINGKGWLKNSVKCDVEVVRCLGYKRDMPYSINIKPSPNLPTDQSIALYPSLCLFEATPVSIGRGTEFPFEVYGHPKMRASGFSFTPKGVVGAMDPPLKGMKCNGIDLREVTAKPMVDLSYIIDAYQQLGMGDKFFTQFFEKLIGVDYVRKMICDGASAEQIRARWQKDIEQFKKDRQPYLLYE